MKKHIRKVSTYTHNVELDNKAQSRDYVTARVHVTRFGVKRIREFLFTKFGGKENAIRKAIEHVEYLKECTPMQFIKATRSIGRPLQSEYFGRRIIAN